MEDDDAFRRLRYTLGVAEGAAEIPPAKCFPLEYNADYLHGVSFHKGCYIGQELTARVHHTGVVRKRIMPVRISGGGAKEDANFVDAAKGKRVGKLRGQLDCGRALGLMRVEECLAAAAGGVRVEAEGEGDIGCAVAKPHWWPQEAPKKKQTKE